MMFLRRLKIMVMMVVGDDGDDDGNDYDNNYDDSVDDNDDDDNGVDDDENRKSDDVLTQAESKWHRGGRKLCLKSLEAASSNIK